MASELKAEISEIKYLARLLTRDDFLINQRRESFKSYIKYLIVLFTIYDSIN